MEEVIDIVTPLWDKTQTICELCQKVMLVKSYKGHCTKQKHLKNVQLQETLQGIRNRQVQEAAQAPFEIHLPHDPQDQELQAVDYEPQIPLNPLPQGDLDALLAYKFPDLHGPVENGMFLLLFVSGADFGFLVDDRERIRAPGGGRKAKRYENDAVRILYSYYQENKGKVFGDEMMQSLLNMLKSDKLPSEDVPETIYLLKKSGEVVLPKQVTNLSGDETDLFRIQKW